jgi:pimeloyl-ACP methyl ester carboxylesterase
MNIARVLSLVILLMLYSFLIYYARKRQQEIFFQPDCKLLQSPPSCTSYGRWRGISYWFLNEFKTRPTILFFHGSGGNVSYNIPLIDFALKYKYNVLLVDYRGYGQSIPMCGHFMPSESSLLQDGQTAYDYLRHEQKVTSSNIIVWGNSLGGLPASSVAANNEIGKLVLWSTFADPGIIIDKYKGVDVTRIDRLLYKTVKPFVSRMNIRGNLMQVKVPTIIIHCKQDEVIPFENALLNLKSLPKRVRAQLLEINGLHCKPILTSTMWDSLVTFLET